MFAQDWTFDGAEGDIVTITMIDSSATQELDPVLYLLDSSGTELYSNDDAEDASVGEYNSQILLFTLPSNDQYRVRASQYGTASGTYVLTLINTR